MASRSESRRDAAVVAAGMGFIGLLTRDKFPSNSNLFSIDVAVVTRMGQISVLTLPVLTLSTIFNLAPQAMITISSMILTSYSASGTAVEGNQIEIRGVGGDAHLGGQDFNNAMVEYCLQEFEKVHGINLAGGRNSVKLQDRFKTSKLLRRLKNECEAKKINLSAKVRVPIIIDAAHNDLNLQVDVTQTVFNALNMHLFQKCVDVVDRVLKSTGVAKGDVDNIVMVGGSLKIPCVQKMVQDYFGGKELSKTIRGDEAVACGAAIQAACMSFHKKEPAKPSSSTRPQERFKLSDVIPHTIGIRVYVTDGDTEDFSMILKKNSRIPCSVKKQYRTVFDEQEMVLIEIYEGESKVAVENHKLEQFVLEKLPPNCPKNEPIDIEMHIPAIANSKFIVQPKSIPAYTPAIVHQIYLYCRV